MDTIIKMFSPKKSRISSPNNTNDTNEEADKDDRIIGDSFQSPKRKQPVMPLEKYANILDFINLKKQIYTSLHQYNTNLNEQEDEEIKIRKYLDNSFRQKVRYRFLLFIFIYSLIILFKINKICFLFFIRLVLLLL
jgi:hypothetical protein